MKRVRGEDSEDPATTTKRRVPPPDEEEEEEDALPTGGGRLDLRERVRRGDFDISHDVLHNGPFYRSPRHVYPSQALSPLAEGKPYYVIDRHNTEYTIRGVGVLGRGSFGKVYKVELVHQGRSIGFYALKVHVGDPAPQLAALRRVATLNCTLPFAELSLPGNPILMQMVDSDLSSFYTFIHALRGASATGFSTYSILCSEVVEDVRTQLNNCYALGDELGEPGILYRDIKLRNVGALANRDGSFDIRLLDIASFFTRGVSYSWTADNHWPSIYMRNRRSYVTDFHSMVMFACLIRQHPGAPEDMPIPKGRPTMAEYVNFIQGFDRYLVGLPDAQRQAVVGWKDACVASIRQQYPYFVWPDPNASPGSGSTDAADTLPVDGPPTPP